MPQNIYFQHQIRNVKVKIGGNDQQQLRSIQLLTIKQAKKNMDSPKQKRNKKSNSVSPDHPPETNLHLGIEPLQGKPWNSSRLAKITQYMGKKAHQNIFSLSNRSSNMNVNEKGEPETSKTYSFKKEEDKPKTAPQNAQNRRKLKNGYLSQQMTKLGPVVTEQVLDDDFEENLESINFYPQFRASLHQRKNLMYLKPYIKSNSKHRKQFNMSTFDGMQKLKTELYKGINSSQVAYTINENQKSQTIEPKNSNFQIKIPNTYRSSIIEYMTEYAGDPKQSKQGIKYSTLDQKGIQKKVQARNKNASLCILREKLKNRYKESNYADKIVRVKMGQGVPITIIQ